MDNSNEKRSEDTAQGANGPIGAGKIKEYGMKAYGPLVNVFAKYQDEFTPYLNALAKGLQGGVDALNAENASEEEKYVSSFFKEAADGLNQACEKINAKDTKALGAYLSDLAERKPSLMFSTSYIAGLFFGRLGRHIVSRVRENQRSDSGAEKNFSVPQSNSTLTNEPPSTGHSIH